MSLEAIFFAVAGSFFCQFINYGRFTMPLTRARKISS